MRSFLIITASLLVSLAAALVCSLAGILALFLVWESFDVCAAFGGPMAGSCGYAFTFFLAPITVLACLLFVTILAFRKIYPWLARRLGAPR